MPKALGILHMHQNLAIIFVHQISYIALIPVDELALMEIMIMMKVLPNTVPTYQPTYLPTYLLPTYLLPS